MPFGPVEGLGRQTLPPGHTSGLDPSAAATASRQRRAGHAHARVRPQFRIKSECVVYCGIHDSNGAYLSHLAARTDERPFSVVSSGTWTVVLSHGSALSRLQKLPDMLANIDAFNRPVPTARFMGGREYERIAGTEGLLELPTEEALNALLHKGIMALPSFAEAGGPYADYPGFFVKANLFSDDTERATLATLYVALMTHLLLEALGAEGEVVVDGPFASNPLFTRILQTIRPRYCVSTNAKGNQLATAAQYLVTGSAPPRRYSPATMLSPAGELIRYRDAWRKRILGLRPN